MDAEWVRWIVGIAIVGISSVGGWLFKRLFAIVDSKANKDSTDARFSEVLVLVKEIHSDQKEHSQHDHKIQTETLAAINDTKVSLATLTAKIDERLPPRVQ